MNGAAHPVVRAANSTQTAIPFDFHHIGLIPERFRAKSLHCRLNADLQQDKLLFAKFYRLKTVVGAGNV